MCFSFLSFVFNNNECVCHIKYDYCRSCRYIAFDFSVRSYGIYENFISAVCSQLTEQLSFVSVFWYSHQETGDRHIGYSVCSGRYRDSKNMLREFSRSDNARGSHTR